MIGLMQKCNVCLANEDQFFLKEKIIFSNFAVAASSERLWQAGISSSGYLGYINMYLLSILISFSFFFFYPAVLSSHNLPLLPSMVVTKIDTQ